MTAPLSDYAVHLRPQDNIAVAAQADPRRDRARARRPHHHAARPRSSMGHKFAVRPIKEGEAVSKYGQIIGFASRGHRRRRARPRPQRRRRRLRARLRLLPRLPAAAAAAGRAAHLHGLRPRPDGPTPALRHAQLHRHHQHRQLLGQHQQVHRRALPRDRPAEAVSRTSTASSPITHKAGCAMQYDGPDHKQLDRTLAGFAKHPNVAAYILVGLGCETGQAIAPDRERAPGADPAQRREEEAAGADHPGVRRHRQDGRGRRARPSPSCCRASTTCSAVELPAKQIILGTNCGGSDGNSGVTANPALGVASDLLVAAGRHQHPRRDAGDLRGRAPAHPPGRLAARSARSWSSGSSGGSGTPASSAPRSTTTRRPATRKAA